MDNTQCKAWLSVVLYFSVLPFLQSLVNKCSKIHYICLTFTGGRGGFLYALVARGVLLRCALAATICPTLQYVLLFSWSKVGTSVMWGASVTEYTVACSILDHQGSDFECCLWRAVAPDSSHHLQEVLLAQVNLYLHKSGLHPYSFIHSFIHSFIDSFVHSFIHSFIR